MKRYHVFDTPDGANLRERGDGAYVLHSDHLADKAADAAMHVQVADALRARIAVLEAEVTVLQRQAEIDKANEMRAMRQRDDARAQAARLEADAGMLDWLENNRPRRLSYYTRDGKRVCVIERDCSFIAYGHGDSIRAAITAAMGKEKQT